MKENEEKIEQKLIGIIDIIPVLVKKLRIRLMKLYNIK